MRKKILYYLFIFCLGCCFFFSFSLVAQAQTSPSPTCSQSGFVTCIQDKFAKKFPFDLFAGIAFIGSTAGSCPKITLLYKDFDICFLLDIVKIIKYPVAVSLLVRLYIFS